MAATDTNAVKGQVKGYWNEEACGTDIAQADKFTIDYFEEIEAYRYRVEPEIFSFAQFTRFYGKKMLEVGVGASTDFLQWVRAGAIAHGVDLTEEGVMHARNRLAAYGLQCEDLQVGDAEHLPFPDKYFDLVYSWGVIHHTPDTLKALDEIIRVARVDGKVKVMVYNRHSLYTLYKYLKWGLLKGRPFRSISDILIHHQESIGTKAYTIKEIRKILQAYDIADLTIKAPASYYDLYPDSSLPIRLLTSLFANILGREKCGWFLMFEFTKRSHTHSA